MKPDHGVYHPGIDGLRAVAVLAVVLFHLDSRLIPSGFIGVDVFFVISGFVVSHAVSSLPMTGFREFVTAFYARRILRIGPALVVCLLLTTLLSCLFIPNAWLSEHNRLTAVAAFFGASNVVLALSANDYFAPRAEFNPFTHTWSLGVEEQFYLCFPIIFFAWAAARSAARRHVALGALVALSVASLALCAWWASTAPTRAFYLLPARFWELGAGVALFLCSHLWAPRLRAASGPVAEAFGVAALAVLAVCLAVADPAAFPFPWAIPAVAASLGLIALAVTRRDTATGQLLASLPMVAVGKVSYSLYLWHWPIFVLFRWTVGIESAGQKVTAVIIAAALAVASYYLVEQPVLRAPRIRALPRLRAALSGLAVVGVSAAIAVGLFLSQSVFSLSTVSQSPDWSVHRATTPVEASLPCKVQRATASMDGVQVYSLQPVGCQRPDDATVYAVGDSHAGAYILMLRLYAQATGRPVYLATQGGCPVFDLKGQPAAGTCAKQVGDEIAMLDRRLKAGDVLFLPSLRLERLISQWDAMSSQPVSAAARRAAIEEAVGKVQGWEQRGVHVVFAAPTPVFRIAPFRCADWFNASNPSCHAQREMPRAEVDAMRRPVLEAMHEISARTGATVWDPTPVLCNGASCPTQLNGRPTFFDGDHLSGYGNVLLWPAFQRFFCEVEGDRRSCSAMAVAQGT